MIRQLDYHEHEAVLRVLPHTPETMIDRHFIGRNLARVYVQGTPEHYEGLVVQKESDPGEVFADGTAQSVAAILAQLTGWFCVEIALSMADELASLLEKQMNVPVKFYGDVFHVLHNPAPVTISPEVRLFTPADDALFAASDPAMSMASFGTMSTLLRESVAAGLVIDGQIRAVACCGAMTEKYGDTYVNTHESLRGQGYATQAASLVAGELIRRGLTPVWSCGEDNFASLAVARKLGYIETSRRTYLIPGR